MSDLVEGLRKGVWGRARRADAAIQTLMQDGADRIETQAARIAELEAEVKMWRNEDKKKQTACEQMGSRIAELEAALKDMAKHVWRGDWDKLKPETRAILEPKE